MAPDFGEVGIISTSSADFSGDYDLINFGKTNFFFNRERLAEAPAPFRDIMDVAVPTRKPVKEAAVLAGFRLEKVMDLHQALIVPEGVDQDEWIQAAETTEDW